MTDQTLNPEVEEEQMGILQHLDVLRIHITRALIGLMIGAGISFTFATWLFKEAVDCTNLSTLFVTAEDIAKSCPEIQFIRPTENIEVYFQIVLLSGLILTMPWVLYQLWAFISPGLLPKEKRLVYIFVPIATLLFLLGVAFAWFVLIPPALNFLNNFLATETTKVEWTADSYFDFMTGFLFWLGTAFQLPLIFYFIGRFGLLGPELLKEGWRFAVVGIAILSAIITPSIDPVTMLLTMAPLTLLYVISIWTSGLGYRQFMRNDNNDSG